MKNLLKIMGLCILLMAAGPSGAQVLCAWDPMGAQGDYSNTLKDYALAAQRWGLHLDIRYYSDEPAVARDLKDGKCDLANLIGIRARSFVPFSGSLDVPGGLDNYAQLREALATVASPRLEKLMQAGGFETVGIIPIGACYPVVNNRSISGIEQARGKRIAVMDWDQTQSVFSQQVDAVPVPMALTEFGPAFNKGLVDVIVAPMVLYKPLELYRGIGNNGGIVRRPMLFFTMQLVARQGAFPAGFGDSSREYMARQLDHAFGIIRNAEAEVQQSHWIYASTASLREYNRIIGNARAHLTDAGFYDRRMLILLKRIRCESATTDDAGCAAGGTP